MSEVKIKPTGGFAFPAHGTPGLDPCGMSLRDYFAAKALPVILQDWINSANDIGSDASETFREVAEEAYQCADAMLEERKP